LYSFLHFVNSPRSIFPEGSRPDFGVRLDLWRGGEGRGRALLILIHVGAVRVTLMKG